MSTISTPSQNDQRLRALDPDLPTLALDAAIDIDGFLLKKTRNFDSMKLLAGKLKDSIKVDFAGSPPRSLMDPATLNVLGEAIAEVTRSKTLKRVDDLLGKAAGIAELLSSDSLQADMEEELEQARDFCLALSKAVMAYHKSILNLHPSHPFRKG